MTTVNFINPRGRFLDANAKPLSGGRVMFFEVGSSTLKDVYSDEAGTVLNANPNVLDGEGYVTPSEGVHLGIGYYDIRVQKATGITPVDPYDIDDPAWSDYYSYPNIPGAALAGAGATLRIGYVNTIEELRGLEAGSFDIVNVYGYLEFGDSFRVVKWNGSATEIDNGGTIFTPVGTPALGRWEWVPQCDDVVTPALFGAFPSDGSLVVATQIDSMIAYCLASDIHKTIHFNQAGEYHINSSSVTGAGLNVIIESGVQFKTNAGSSSIDFNCDSLVIKGRGQIVFPSPIGASITMSINTKEPINVMPEWWGVDPTNTFNSAWTMNHLSTRVGKSNILEFNGIYNFASTNIDLTGFTLQFNQASKVLCNGSGLIVDNLIKNSTLPIFGGDSLSILKFVQPFAKSEWLEWTESNVIKPFLNDFITLNTDAGIRQFRFEVGAGVHTLGYSIIETSRANRYHLKFNWTFTEGSLFSCNATGYVEFGNVIAGAYKIFSPIASGDFHMRFINDIKLSWFGAVSSQSDVVDNANAIRSAYSQVVASNGSTVHDYIQRISLDLDGGTYQTNTVLVTYNTNFSDAIVPVKNGVIWGDVDGGVLVDLGHGLEASNLTLESRGDGATLLSVDSSTIKFNRCNLLSRDTLIDSYSTDKLVITDSDLYVTDATSSTVTMITHNGKNSVIKDSILHRLNVDATGPCNIILTGAQSYIKNNESEGVTLATDGAGVISDNFLEKASIVSNNPASTIITGNSIRTSDVMDAKILFTGTASWLVKGLICENNTFVDGVIDPLTRTQYSCIVKSGSFAASGHKCSIKNNYLNYDYLRAMATTIDALSSLGTLLIANTYTLTIDFKQTTLTSPLFFDLIDNTVNVNEITHEFLNGGGGDHDGYLTFYAYETAPLGNFILDIKPYVNNYLGSLSLHIVASTLSTPFQPIGTIAIV